MEIVINIPVDEYNAICNGTFDTDGYFKMNLSAAFNDGTPLPENHGDLIDVNRKITVSTYDEQYEEWGEETLTVLEALNKWSDEGVTVKDVIIPADTEGEE